MGSKEKLVERFKKLPKDFTFEETLVLLRIFGYENIIKGLHLVLAFALRMKKQANL